MLALRAKAAWATVRRVARKVPASLWYGAVALAGVLVLLAYCSSDARRDERDKIEREQTQAYVQDLQTDGKAKERAAGERLSDLTINNDREKALTNAVQNLPDARPSDRRVAINCERLRAQGRDPADIPACRGLGR